MKTERKRTSGGTQHGRRRQEVRQGSSLARSISGSRGGEKAKQPDDEGKSGQMDSAVADDGVWSARAARRVP